MSSLRSDLSTIPIIDIGPIILRRNSLTTATTTTITATTPSNAAAAASDDRKAQAELNHSSVEMGDADAEQEEKALSKLAAQWDHAFRTLGFAIITNHGVDSSLVESLYTRAREFFEQSREEKLRYFRNEGYGTGGYVPMGMEAVGRTNHKGEKAQQDSNPESAAVEGQQGQQPKTVAKYDLVESLVHRVLAAGSSESENHANDIPVSMRHQVELYCGQMLRLLHTLMRLSAMALHLPKADFFEPYYTRPGCALRLAYYPPQYSDNGSGDGGDGVNGHAVEKVQVSPGQLRYGAHTDYTGFTILRQDPQVGGLEVLALHEHDFAASSASATAAAAVGSTSGEWIPVPLVPNSFVVNAGDLIQHWTNGVWRSNLHRVVNPLRGSEEALRGRLSMVFFTGPNDDALVEPLRECVEENGGEGHHHHHHQQNQYKPVRAGEYLLEKLKKSNV